MAVIPFDALRISFLQTGQSDSFTDGLVHTKTVPHAILALPRYGEYEITANRQTITAGADEAFLTPPQCPMRIVHHGSPRHAGQMSARWLHFSMTVFGSVDLATLFRFPLKIAAPEGVVLAKLVDEIIALESPDEARDIRPAVRMNECLWQVIRILVDISTPSPMADEFLKATTRFRPLLSEMHSQPGRTFAIRQMAEQVEMSRSQFQHAFRQALGLSPMRYLKRIRLGEAAQRLTSTDLTLAEIAEDVGYTNPFHLSRDFKRQFQLSPRDYRAAHDV